MRTIAQPSLRPSEFCAMLSLMSDEVREAVASKVEAEEVEHVGADVFIPIFSLESGTRFGLDEHGGWAMVEAGAQQLIQFQTGKEMYFLELLEHARDAVEVQIGEGAAKQGLPSDGVTWSLPAIELVRVVCQLRKPHFCRLALLWLLPSELRELRDELAALSEDHKLPQALRDLASRLAGPVGQP